MRGSVKVERVGSSGQQKMPVEFILNEWIVEKSFLKRGFFVCLYGFGNWF